MAERLAVLLAFCCALSPALVGASQVLPAQGSVEVAFSPDDAPQQVLVDLIAGARESIHVQAYIFTSRTLARALIEAYERGVKVEVLADARMHRRADANVLPRLIEAGIPVAVETEFAAAHNKVIIVDAGVPGCTVVTGSYNFTWSAANRNAENILVLRDNCVLADVYLENWQRHREAATHVNALPERISADDQ